MHLAASFTQSESAARTEKRDSMAADICIVRMEGPFLIVKLTTVTIVAKVGARQTAIRRPALAFDMPPGENGSYPRCPPGEHVHAA